MVFRSATEPFDTSTPAGRMMVQMLGVFAEFERATIIDRITAGMERKAARGGWQNGSTPTGYTLDHATGHLAINPQEAPLVREVFDLYVHKRLGVQAVAAALNERGHRTRAGKPFSGKTVLTILHNRAYLGEVYFRGTWHTGTTGPFHPTLVEADTFQTAQHILALRGDDHSKRAAGGSDYLLAGLMTCARCGKRYLGTAAHGRTRRYRYYTCFTRSRYGTTSCPAPRLTAGQVEHAILDAVQATYARSDLIDQALARVADRSTSQRDQHQQELDTVHAELTKTENAIERYLAAFEAGTMPETTCGPRVEKLAAQASRLRTRQHELHDLIDAASASGPTHQQLQWVPRSSRTVFLLGFLSGMEGGQCRSTVGSFLRSSAKKR